MDTNGFDTDVQFGTALRYYNVFQFFLINKNNIICFYVIVISVNPVSVLACPSLSEEVRLFFPII
jgi:hypothetical protein